jgi:hypothetical protein
VCGVANLGCVADFWGRLRRNIGKPDTVVGSPVAHTFIVVDVDSDVDSGMGDLGLT